MTADIRDHPRLAHDDIVALNFVRKKVPFIFRRHYRTGLRSHIMEVLNPVDVRHQEEGVTIDGVRWFPRPAPLKMLRIFRTRFEELESADEELDRVRMVNQYLGPDYVAGSEEFLVDYRSGGRRDRLLCGLQEYVTGEVIDPWGRLDSTYLMSLMGRLRSRKAFPVGITAEEWLVRVRDMAQAFLRRLQRMIENEKLIPDLAGVGNLLITPSGRMKLVDINNISAISSGSAISLDDRGYPVCDKSIQALFILQEKVAGDSGDADALYQRFLDPERMKQVEAMVRRFHLNMASCAGASSYPRG
ncbi:MAG: hypothetical protein U5R49_22895 [Deltaproteobacteria bacterium]|nr:hypothetical protein [Deltaproteobacteria bacterium]